MARKKPPSFDFFADDFIAGTYHMEAEAVGIYIRLLCYQWSNGSIPDDEPTLCKIAGVDANALRTHMRSVMRKLCVGNAGELYNERLEIERAKKLEIIEKAKRSAEQRWSKENKGKTETDPKNDGCGRNANAYANAMPTQCSLLPTSSVLLPNDYNTHTLPAKQVCDKYRSQGIQITEAADGVSIEVAEPFCKWMQFRFASDGKHVNAMQQDVILKKLLDLDSSKLARDVDFSIGIGAKHIRSEDEDNGPGRPRRSGGDGSGDKPLKTYGEKMKDKLGF